MPKSLNSQKKKKKSYIVLHCLFFLRGYKEQFFFTIFTFCSLFIFPGLLIEFL